MITWPLRASPVVVYIASPPTHSLDTNSTTRPHIHSSALSLHVCATQVLSLWERIWSCPLTRHLHLYLAAAVLIQHRRLLLANPALDFDGLLAFAVESAGKLDLGALLQLAEALVVVSGPAGQHCCEGLP